MRSHSPGVEPRSSIANMEGYTFNTSRNKRGHNKDSRGRNPVRRKTSDSRHVLAAIGQASGALARGEISEDVKTESISADSSFEVLFQLTTGIARSPLPPAGQS